MALFEQSKPSSLARVPQVSLALEPPVAIVTARICVGLFSLRFPRARLFSTGAPACVEVGCRPRRIPLPTHTRHVNILNFAGCFLAQLQTSLLLPAHLLITIAGDPYLSVAEPA